MKKTIRSISLAIVAMMIMSSCYTYSFTVGNGAQGDEKIKEMNNYFLYGLVTGTLTTHDQLAGNAQNYDVTIKHRFVDGLLSSITFGIFTPTTTIVTK